VTVDEVLARAHARADEGDWEGMAETIREHLSDHEDEPALHCWLGVAERELGLEGVAYERFKRALALEPTDPFVLATAGSGIATFDDPDAERALRVAALTAPKLAMTRLLYGAYLSREGFAAESLAELRAASELDPEDPQVAYELGVAHALAGNPDAAADALADAVRFNPEDGWARVVFGLVLLEAGRTEEAVGELVSGARIADDDVDAQIAAALAAAATDREDIAYEMLERARLGAAEHDLELLQTVEERIEVGVEAEEMLVQDFAPDLLRARLLVRP